MVVSTAAAADVWLPPATVGAEVVAGCDVASVGPLAPAGAVATTLSERMTERVVESAVVRGRRAPLFGRNSGGTMMTIAVSSNARKKRLSIELMGPKA